MLLQTSEAQLKIGSSGRGATALTLLGDLKGKYHQQHPGMQRNPNTPNANRARARLACAIAVNDAK